MHPFIEPYNSVAVYQHSTSGIRRIRIRWHSTYWLVAQCEGVGWLLWWFALMAKPCDIRERNVTIKSENWTTNICSLGFWNIRERVTFWSVILQSLGCIMLTPDKRFIAAVRLALMVSRMVDSMSLTLFGKISGTVGIWEVIIVHCVTYWTYASATYCSVLSLSLQGLCLSNLCARKADCSKMMSAFGVDTWHK